MSESSYIECLYVLEVVRDTVETTPDETEIVAAAHDIVQEYKRNGELPAELTE